MRRSRSTSMAVAAFVVVGLWAGQEPLEPARRAATVLVVPARVISIYDGDTATVDAFPWPRTTIRVSVRLAGIDTPERRGKCPEEKRLAEAARREFTRLLGGAGSEVALVDPKAGKYAGRVVSGIILPDGRDAVKSLLAGGHGRPYDGGRRQGWCEERP